MTALVYIAIGLAALAFGAYWLALVWLKLFGDRIYAAESGYAARRQRHVRKR